MGGEGRIVYLDNAATSWPKPACVSDAMAACMRESGGNPGRSGHRLSIAAGRVVAEAREAVAEALGAGDPLRVAFAANATAAINAALLGVLRPGDRVVADSLAHNAVARPLTELGRNGLAVEWIRCGRDGSVDLGHAEALVRGRGGRAARMLIVTHGSNVCGSLAPLGELAAICARHGTTLLVDAAQTAGVEYIGLDSLGDAMVAFTGHKAMLGPGGTGGLALSSRADIERVSPVIRGGTGSASDSEDQPAFMPDRLEAGTTNAPGLAGLAAGLAWIGANGGRESIREHERRLTENLVSGVAALPGAIVYGPEPGRPRCAVMSFTLDGWSCSDLALALDERFGVLCRVGLHCAPRAHRTLGTFPDGTARFAPGPFTTEADVAYALGALAELASEGGRS